MASSSNGHVLDTFAVDRASELTGVSESQIRRWDNDGVLSPTWTGPRRNGPFSRIYSLTDLLGLRVLAELKQLGVSPQQLKEIASRLPTSEHPWNRRFWVDRKSGEVFLSARETDEHSAGSDATIAVVDPDAAAEALDERLAAARARTSERGLIVTDRNIHGGEPIFAGTRIPVSTIVEFLAEGADDEAILAEYPRLTHEDLQSAREFSRHGSAA